MKKPIILKLKDFRYQYMTFEERKDRDFFNFNSEKYNIYIQSPSSGQLEKICRMMCYTDCHWQIFREYGEDYNDRDFDEEETDGFDKFEDLNVYIFSPYPPVIRTDISSGVYFIGEPNLDRIKIGRSKNVKQRLSQLKTVHPELKVYGVIENGIERKLHRQFAFVRQDGEWFTKTQELKEFILNIEYSKQSPLIQEILENRQELFVSE
jgi:hypothetical protein